MKKTDPCVQNTILTLLQQGHSVKYIASRLGVSVFTVSKLRSQHLPGLKRQPSGRPRILSDADKRIIKRRMISGDAKTAKEVFKYLQREGRRISYTSVRNNLRSIGLKAKRKPKKPYLTFKQKNERYRWAQTHINWTVEDWKRVIFSDETKIQLWNSDGVKWCWMRDGEEFQELHIEPTVKFGGGHLMFWGCMTWQGLGYGCQIYDGTMKSPDYIQILDTTLQDTLKHYRYRAGEFIFQHDNHPAHTSAITKKYILDAGIELLPWPAQSADLNPIEHVWTYLKARIGAHEKRPKSIHELWEVILEEWERVPPDFLQRLYESMPRRVAAVLKAKGGQTKY